jgi:hypothetical protein
MCIYKSVTGREAPDHYLATWWPDWLWLPQFDGLAIGKFIFLHSKRADEADYCHELEHVRQWQSFGPKMWIEWIKNGFYERNHFERDAYNVEFMARRYIYYTGFDLCS